MKYLLFTLFVLAFVFAISPAFAEPIAIGVLQQRGSVESDLSTSRGYVRVGGLPAEIVKDGNLLGLAQLLHPNTWNPDIGLDKLKTLVIQHLHLKNADFKSEAVDSVAVPYVSEVYFQQRHDSVKILGMNAGEGVQGTIRFSGHLVTRMLAGHIAAVEVKVDTYQLSSPAENAVANLSEYVNRYDPRFLNDVATSVFTHLFQKPEYRFQLKQVIDTATRTSQKK